MLKDKSQKIDELLCKLMFFLSTFDFLDDFLTIKKNIQEMKKWRQTPNCVILKELSNLIIEQYQ